MTKRRSPYIWVMTKEYPPLILGGLGTVATELTRALTRSNVKANVITKSSSRSIRHTTRDGVALLQIPTHKRFYTGFAYRPRKTMQAAKRYFSGKPDVIHVHSLEFAKAAVRYKRKYRIPVLYTCHSLVSNSRKDARRKKNQHLLFRHANRIVVPSVWLKKTIRRSYAGVASKISVIPHGVKSAPNGTKAGRLRLLFVGRLIRSKGIEPLLRSVSLLSARNRQVRLTVIGKGSRRYERRLRMIARKQGISTKVRWMGFVPYRKVRRLYASHGAVVVPSQKESFCLVALEAMASGIPLVSTRAGGLREFVNRRNAQIITSVSAEGIRRAVEVVWKHPIKTRQRIANGKSASKRYSWKRRAEQYKKLLMRLQSRNRRVRKRVNTK